jgi:hypothetical protein
MYWYQQIKKMNFAEISFFKELKEVVFAFHATTNMSAKFLRQKFVRKICPKNLSEKFVRKICPKNLSEKFVQKICPKNLSEMK